MSSPTDLTRWKYSILGVLVGISGIVLAFAAVRSRGLPEPEVDALTLLLFTAPFVLIGIVCDLVDRRERRRWTAIAVFVASSAPPLILVSQTWIGIAASLEQNAWTGAALSHGLGWMMVTGSAVVGVVLWVAVVQGIRRLTAG